MTMNFNDAPEQREGAGDLIPAGTVVPLQVRLKRGGAGEDGWLTRSSKKGTLGLDMELRVYAGDYKGCTIYQWGTLDADKEKATQITRALVRGILESAHGIASDDMSERAIAARQIPDFGAIDCLRFCGRVGIEKGGVNPQTGDNYKDKNRLLKALAPGDDEYVPCKQVKSATAPAQPPTAAAAPVAAAAAATAPADPAGFSKPAGW